MFLNNKLRQKYNTNKSISKYNFIKYKEIIQELIT